MDFVTLGLSLAKSIYNLRERCQQMKIDVEELKELEEHITYIKKIFDHKKGGASSSSSSKQVSDPHEERFKGKLKEVKKTIDGWLSKEPGLFAIFTSNLTKELEGLNRKIHRAIDAYQLAIIVNPRVPDPNSKQPRRSASVEPRKVPREPSRHHEPKPKTPEPRKVPREPSRHHEPKPKTPEPRKVPREPSRHHEPKPKTPEQSKVHPKPREAGHKDSNPQGSGGPTHHQPKHETHTWVYLWAPLDSEKQAKDVEDKLKNSRDVKVEEVSCDQPIKKVMVKVKAVKDDSKTIQTLLRETKDALPSFKALPTLWKNRPK